MSRSPKRLVAPVTLLVAPDQEAAAREQFDEARKQHSKSIINTSSKSDPDKQATATPWAFIHALEHRFGVPVGFDLAATAENKKTNKKTYESGYFGPGSAFGEDALARDWTKLPGTVELAYLNPPFAHLPPWAQRLAHCRWEKRWTVMLAPASYSTDWFLDLRGKVQIDAIPRIQFEGAEHLYPKDLALFVAGYGVNGSGYWDWRAAYWMWCRERAGAPDAPHHKGNSKFPEVPIMPEMGWPEQAWKWELP